MGENNAKEHVDVKSKTLKNTDNSKQLSKKTYWMTNELLEIMKKEKSIEIQI